MKEKSSYYQYRITFNDSVGPIVDKLDNEHWSKCCEIAENRGLYAKLERRLITESDILSLIEDHTGFIKLGNMVICKWEVLAECNFVGS